MRDIKSRLDNQAPAVAKLHTQSTGSRRWANQLYRQQLCGWSRGSSCAFQMAIVIQRVNSQTARFAKRLPLQTALFKVPYQTFCLCLAPTASCNNLSRFTHASTSTCKRTPEKSGFARMDTAKIYSGR